MNIFSILFLIPFIFAAPSVEVMLSDKLDQNIELRMEGVEESFEQCLESGLEVRYRFEYQVCKKRSAWFDGCTGISQTVNRVLYDPISEKYKVFHDRHGDEEEALTKSVRTLREAIKAASIDRDLPLKHISREEPGMLLSKRAYLSVHGKVTCHGSYNKTLVRIYNVITFGIAGEEGIQTPWRDILLSNLKGKESE